MTLGIGRRALTLGFAAVCGIGAGTLPAAAQSYLSADNGSNVTVDYSVLGQGGPGPVNRAPLPGGAMPAGTCSCANAPMGVIAAPPRPTFTNPFGLQVTQAPVVPPGFMAYNQAVGGSSSSGSAVVLRQPGSTSQMASNEPAPVEDTPLPVTTDTANTMAGSEPAPSAEPNLSKTTPTQTESQPATTTTAATSDGATPPAQPEPVPDSVPSPVTEPQKASDAPQVPAAEAPAGTDQMPAEEKPAENATTPENPPAATADTGTQPAEPTQEAAVTPPAPTEGSTPPATGGTLPAGATRILYTGASDDVPAASTAELDKIATDLLANQDKRIQVMSYAAGTEDTESKARRKSLARGLAIRSYLIKAGVPSTRIDVRALGNKAEGGPADRVDIIPAS